MIFYQIELFQKNKSIECIIYERVNLKKCIQIRAEFTKSYRKFI